MVKFSILNFEAKKCCVGIYFEFNLFLITHTVSNTSQKVPTETFCEKGGKTQFIMEQIVFMQGAKW